MEFGENDCCGRMHRRDNEVGSDPSGVLQSSPETSVKPTIVYRVLRLLYGIDPADDELMRMLRDPHSAASRVFDDFLLRIKLYKTLDLGNERREWLEYLKATQPYRQSSDDPNPILGDRPRES